MSRLVVCEHGLGMVCKVTVRTNLNSSLVNNNNSGSSSSNNNKPNISKCFQTQELAQRL